jgi:hypothetical protein
MSYIPRQDAAIAYIQSSFPPSPTHISFNGSVVNIDQIIPAPIPDIICREGMLTVPASTELRMRYWHLLDPQQSIHDLLTRCLAKGLPYSISSKLSVTSSNNAIRACKSETHLIPQDRSEKLSIRIVNEYLANVRTVLRRPHSYKFLEQGGLLWRIVREYSPEVYTNAFTSRAAALNNDEGYNAPITAEEIQMLLGMTTNNNSFWPYPMWYEQSTRFNGEWTEANEQWFVKHLEDIQYLRPSGFRAGQAWQTTIRTHTHDRASDPTNSGTIAHAKAHCSHLVETWPELLDGFNVMCLT